MKQNLLRKFWLRACMLVAVVLCGAGSAWGETVTYKLTIDASDFNTTSYAANNNEKTSNAVCTTDNTKTYEVKWTSSQVMKSSNNMQWQKSKGYIYNSTDLGTITNVTVTSTAGTFTTYYGTEEQPSSGNSGSGKGYFKTSVGSATGTTSKIEVTFTISEGGTPVPSLSVSPSSISFGENAINSSKTETFTVTYANLTQDLTVSVGSGLTGVTVSPTTISKNATSPQTVTVTYAPTAEGIISGDITVSNSADEVSETVAVTGSAYDTANVPTYNLFTGDLEEGDYIICYNGFAMKNTIASNRFTYETVTPEDGVITTTDASIVWHIAREGDYWTIYNTAVGKYAAGTSTKNQGALISSVTDLAKWTVTYNNGAYNFENLGRSQSTSDSGNKWLRSNGVNGYACYSNSTGGVPSLYKLNDGTTSIYADDVNIAYNATSGSVLYTITNPDAGTTLTASTTASWLTVGTPADGTIALTCTANSKTTARMATVTLTYGTLTKEVTVTQAAAPVIYSTIPALFEVATSTETAVYVTFNNWVVSSVSTNGKNVFVTDNAGNGFVIYSNENQSSTYSVGSILSGTAVPCTLKKYNGFAELLNVNATNLTITTGGTVAVQNIALADLTGLNTGALVSYSGLTCEVTTSTNNGNTYTNYDLSDGTTTIRAFTTLYDFTTNEEIVDGNTYNITGIYQQYNTTKEILPRSEDDIEDYVAPSHIAHFFVNGAETSSAEVSEGDAITFPADPEDINGKTFVGWTTSALAAEQDEAPAMVGSATMGTADVTYYAVFANQEGASGIGTATLTSADIKSSYEGPNSYAVRAIVDSEGKTWNAYASSYQHSNATSDYYYLQIKKSDNQQKYYIQVPEMSGTITSLTMTVSGSSQPMTGGGNNSTLFFSNSNMTSAEGEGVASGQGGNSITLDCSSLDLNTGYITASGAVRIWDVTVTYSSVSYTGYCTTVTTPVTEAYAVVSTDGTNITFYYDANKSTREGTKYNITDNGSIPWWNEQSNLTSATFDQSFAQYTGLTRLDGWFNTCGNLTTITGLQYLNTSNVTNMFKMFAYCDALKSLDLSSFDTQKVTNMESMFEGCDVLETLDLSGFNTAAVQSMRAMFNNCEALTTIYVSSSWTTSGLTATNIPMFEGCASLVGGAGTPYASGYAYENRAIIDGGADNPGYLTDKNNPKIEVKVGNALYTTFVAPAAVSFPSSVTAYIVTAINASSMHMEEVTAVPAGTAVVVKAAVAGTYVLTRVESATVSGNLLQASDGSITGDGSTIYALGVGKGDEEGIVGFYKVKSGSKVPAGKAYIVVSSSNPVKNYIAFDFGGTDAIENLNLNVNDNATIYNVAGQRVGKMTKGIYVVNGKKVIVK